MNICILGAGLVGRAIAIDLAKEVNLTVTSVDKNSANIELLTAPDIKTYVADATNPEQLKRVIENSDIVVNAVPGAIGFSVLRDVIDAGKNVVDIAFYAEDPFLLDELAKERGVTAIVDCGVAPGLSNLLTGFAASKLDSVDTAITYVGGLPLIRDNFLEYKCVFSITDVLEEYTRPARIIENFQEVVKPALSECELLEFENVGTLEAFNSDGLRTLMRTIPAREMKEKTLRYPGHTEKMRILREAGFFSKEPVTVDGLSISPFSYTAKLFAESLKLLPGDRDLTTMRVLMTGVKDGKIITYRYELLDHYDVDTNTHSMARTTGYTAAMAVRMLAQKLFQTPGITPPELLGKDENLVQFILEGLKERGILLQEIVE